MALCWVLDMCVTTYTRVQLISVNNNTLRPSSAVLSSISDCVLTVSHHQQSQKRRKTRRRHRAGRGSRRTISSVIGNRPHDVHCHQTQSHQCHLVSFRPVNNLEHQKSANLCHLVTVQKSVIQRDTQKYGIEYHLYADDGQLHLSFSYTNPSHLDTTISRLEECITVIKKWMTVNFLQLNDDKTEFLYLSMLEFHSHQLAARLAAAQCCL